MSPTHAEHAAARVSETERQKYVRLAENLIELQAEKSYMKGNLTDLF